MQNRLNISFEFKSASEAIVEIHCEEAQRADVMKFIRQTLRDRVGNKLLYYINPENNMLKIKLSNINDNNSVSDYIASVFDLNDNVSPKSTTAELLSKLNSNNPTNQEVIFDPITSHEKGPADRELNFDSEIEFEETMEDIIDSLVNMDQQFPAFGFGRRC